MEYIDIALTSTMPMTAVSRYGTESHLGSSSPMNATGSFATARCGELTAITAPVATIGGIVTSAPPTAAATIARSGADLGR